MFPRPLHLPLFAFTWQFYSPLSIFSYLSFSFALSLSLFNVFFPPNRTEKRKGGEGVFSLKFIHHFSCSGTIEGVGPVTVTTDDYKTLQVVPCCSLHKIPHTILYDVHAFHFLILILLLFRRELSWMTSSSTFTWSICSILYYLRLIETGKYLYDVSNCTFWMFWLQLFSLSVPVV